MLNHSWLSVDGEDNLNILVGFSPVCSQNPKENPIVLVLNNPESKTNCDTKSVTLGWEVLSILEMFPFEGFPSARSVGECDFLGF